MRLKKLKNLLKIIKQSGHRIVIIQKMDNRDTILSELKEIAPTLLTLNKNVYTVPDGYFNKFADELNANIKTQEFLVSIDKQAQVFQVPDDYFQKLPQSILSKIRLNETECYDELEEIAPSLNLISKENLYTVPEVYFNNLKFDVPSEKVSTGKIVFLRKTRRLISYAAAAIIAGVLVTGAFFYPDNNTSFDVSKEVNKLSDAELNSYLDTSHSVSFFDDTMLLNQETPNIQEHLQLISDLELQQYLEESGS